MVKTFRITGEKSLLLPSSSANPLLTEGACNAPARDGEDFRMTGEESLLRRLPLQLRTPHERLRFPLHVTEKATASAGGRPFVGAFNSVKGSRRRQLLLGGLKTPYSPVFDCTQF